MYCSSRYFRAKCHAGDWPTGSKVTHAQSFFSSVDSRPKRKSYVFKFSCVPVWTLPFLNLLDILTVNNVYRLHALKFTHLWHKGHLPSLFDNLFQYASYQHTHNTRYALKQNFCKPRPRTNTGKQMFSYQAIDLWRDIPYNLKDFSTFSFAKEIKHYFLSEQYSKKFE